MRINIKALFIIVLSFICCFNLIAEPKLTQITDNDSAAAVLNNLANLYLTKTDEKCTKLDSAIMFYQQACHFAPCDGGIRFNLGIAYLMKGDAETADSLFVVGFKQCQNNREQAYQLLGMDFEKEKTDKGITAGLTETQLRENLEKSFSKIKPKKLKKDQKADAGNTQSKGKKRKVLRSAGNKSFDPKALKSYLYWKL